MGLFIDCHFYEKPGIIRIVKSRRLRWAGHMARMEMKEGMETACRKNRREAPSRQAENEVGE